MIFHHSGQKAPKNHLLIILINKLMNNGANPKSYISGFSANLIEISQIWSRLTGSDKSLTEGGDQIKSKLILSILYGEFHPPSLLKTFLAHLDEFWWMLQSIDWGVSQISPPIDSCTQWDSDLAQLDIDQALMDSPSADFIWFHEDLCPPWAGSHVFCIYPSTTSSSKLIRAGLKGLPL